MTDCLLYYAVFWVCRLSCSHIEPCTLYRTIWCATSLHPQYEMYFLIPSACQILTNTKPQKMFHYNAFSTFFNHTSLISLSCSVLWKMSGVTEKRQTTLRTRTRCRRAIDGPRRKTDRCRMATLPQTTTTTTRWSDGYGWEERGERMSGGLVLPCPV